jgi:hypothetical protein
MYTTAVAAKTRSGNKQNEATVRLTERVERSHEHIKPHIPFEPVKKQRVPQI